ncbi:MAG: hypothetical protein DRH06_00020 [Deltaproteobacteria bacterium]|nr:MAG: hypothetical protein DRH06_00020 [Deltaproteobacteria bacterium]
MKHFKLLLLGFMLLLFTAPAYAGVVGVLEEEPFYTPPGMEWVDQSAFNGPQGEQGVQGVQGIQGEQGLPGKVGDTGKQGVAGADGTDGAKGDKGVAGADGLDGIDGKDGSDADASRDIKKLQREQTRLNAVAVAMGSLELDPTRKGLSLGLGLGVANVGDDDDKVGGAVGLMYGISIKEHPVAVNIKYGQSGSYASAGAGLTIGF